MYLQRATASLIPYWSASIQKNQPWSLIGWREYKPISPNLLKIDEKKRINPDLLLVSGKVNKSILIS